MPEPVLASRLADIRARIATAQQKGGWTAPVRIIAVTKTHGAEAVRAAAAAGLEAVGENRVQEAIGKQGDCAGVPIAWHLIGPLQGNKVRQITGRFALLHAVDRLDLATEISRRATTDTPQPVLVQVNCSAEPQKNGIEPDALPALLDAMRELPGIAVHGLMTMAALSDDERVQRRAFAMLRTARDAMTRNGHALPELSMGMSGDFEAAVAEGATMVRLGTILFGERA